MIPDWPGSPVLQQSPYRRQGVDNMVKQHEIDPDSIAVCEDEERGHEPRNATASRSWKR